VQAKTLAMMGTNAHDGHKSTKPDMIDRHQLEQFHIAGSSRIILGWLARQMVAQAQRSAPNRLPVEARASGQGQVFSMSAKEASSFIRLAASWFVV
jgi:hypothetical protein